ncbi:MAG: alcohol dehydrogenase catalytic domain-containing protein [Gemmataceae bacterium]|nr:alcohol dehydrogenase catalytic domain-containing protein [Gemmataceae bacterium]
MKSLVTNAAGWSLREDQLPVPAPGEAVVRPARLAIGPAEIAESSANQGVVLGREFVGVVERVEPLPGRPSPHPLTGRRVTGSAHVACAACDRCRSGLSAHCRQRVTLGTPRKPGCFAEAFTISVANLVEVPAAITDDEAVLAPAIAAAVHIAGTVPAATRPFVTVLGDTVEGLLTALLLWRRKETVRMLTAGPVAASVCEKWGLKHRSINEAGRRQDQDLVIETSGSPGGFAAAVEFVRPRGRILLTRSPRPGDPSTMAEFLGSIVRQEIEVCGVRGEDFPGALALLKTASLQVASLVTARGTFEQAPALLAEVRHSDLLRLVLASPARA